MNDNTKPEDDMLATKLQLVKPVPNEEAITLVRSILEQLQTAEAMSFAFVLAGRKDHNKATGYVISAGDYSAVHSGAATLLHRLTALSVPSTEPIKPA